MFEPMAFATYFGVMSITPGPNNLMLASAGVNFGLRRTLPHLFGVVLGCTLQMVLAVLLFAGLMWWLEGWRLPLAVAGCVYLLWLAWVLWRAAAPGEAAGRARPMSFAGAVLFQWVNPKAWMMALNSALVFAPGGAPLRQLLVMALLAAAVNLPCIGLWALGGDRLRRVLQAPAALRAFNALMALLLAATALWLLAAEFSARLLAGG